MRLSKPISRALALTLLACVVALVWNGIVEPAVSLVGDSGDSRWKTLRGLGRSRAVMMQDAEVKSGLDRIAASTQWAKMYEGTKPEAAVLSLQTDLRSIFPIPGTLTSMTIRQARLAGTLTQLTVKVTLTMPLDQFIAAVARLESQPKLLRIEQLAIQAPDYQSAETNPALNIQADISGFMLSAKDGKAS